MHFKSISRVLAFESNEVIKPYFVFAVDFTHEKAHNMLSLMLDPRYKGLLVIIDYLGRVKAMHIVAKYDQPVLVPLLINVSWLLIRAWRITWHPHWRLQLILFLGTQVLQRRLVRAC